MCVDRHRRSWLQPGPDQVDIYLNLSTHWQACFRALNLPPEVRTRHDHGRREQGVIHHVRVSFRVTRVCFRGLPFNTFICWKHAERLVWSHSLSFCCPKQPQAKVTSKKYLPLRPSKASHISLYWVKKTKFVTGMWKPLLSTHMRQQPGLIFPVYFATKQSVEISLEWTAYANSKTRRHFAPQHDDFTPSDRPHCSVQSNYHQSGQQT